MFACMYLNVCMCSHLNAHMSVGEVWAWSRLTFGHKVSWVMTWVCHSPQNSLSVTCSSCWGQLEEPPLRSFFCLHTWKVRAWMGADDGRAAVTFPDARTDESKLPSTLPLWGVLDGMWHLSLWMSGEVTPGSAWRHSSPWENCNQWESKGAAPTWAESLTSPPRTSGRSSMCG